MVASGAATHTRLPRVHVWRSRPAPIVQAVRPRGLVKSQVAEPHLRGLLRGCMVDECRHELDANRTHVRHSPVLQVSDDSFRVAISLSQIQGEFHKLTFDPETIRDDPFFKPQRPTNNKRGLESFPFGFK